jgi:hypothetical protein
MSERFFIIGAQRSGTTYLYHLLAEHPEIEMARPYRPEPKFFLRDEQYRRGLAYYESHYFPGKPGAWLKGEKTTSYIESAQVAQRLATHYPTAKIIILMRDPIQRAISNYWFSVKNGLESWSLEQALLADASQRQGYDPRQISTNPFDYLRRGLYISFIEVYDAFFPAEQIHGLLYEEIVGNLTQAQALYAFLGVSAEYAPVNLDRIINEGDKREDSISPAMREYLVNYYAEANGRLAARFGFDLAKWWSMCQ